MSTERVSGLVSKNKQTNKPVFKVTLEGVKRVSRPSLKKQKNKKTKLFLMLHWNESREGFRPSFEKQTNKKQNKTNQQKQNKNKVTLE